MTNATKITVMNYLIFMQYNVGLYEAQNADNARTLGIWFDANSVKFMLETTSLLSDGDSSVCN